MEKLKCKVILLAGNDSTLKKGDILKTFGTLAICEDEKEEYGQHHLYFVSERKPSKGDKVICIGADEDGTIEEMFKRVGTIMNYTGKELGIIKIEASTNKSLDLPGLPKHFIEEYVAKQGKIDEIYLWYDSDNRVPMYQGPANLGLHIIPLPIKDSFSTQEIKELYNQWIKDSAKPRESGSCYFEEWLDKHY